MVEAKFSILCSAHEACPDVKHVLEGLEFHSIKDLNSARSSYDISAKIEVRNDKETRDIVHELFTKAGQKVQTVEVTMAP